MSELSDFLAHYGVKGMRWGVRKSNSESNNSTPSTSSKKKTAAKVATGVAIAGVTLLGAKYAHTQLQKNGSISLAKAVRAGKTISTNSDGSYTTVVNSGGSKSSAKTVRNVVKAASQGKKIETTKDGYTIIVNSGTQMRKPSKEVQSIINAHEKSRQEFARWLTLRERDLGYKYKGPTDW